MRYDEGDTLRANTKGPGHVRPGAARPLQLRRVRAGDNSVENAIQYFLDVSDRRRSRERLAPFRVARLDERNQDREAFFKGLERSGPRAVQEFRDAFGA